MKRLIIHAGMPKAGSSALQVFLAINSNRLRELSVEYFAMGEIEKAKRGHITSGNGAFLARSRLTPQHPAFHPSKENSTKNLLEKIQQSDCETGVLSSEFFFNVDPRELHDISNLVAELGVRTKIITYIRKQDQFVASSYVQQIKRHGLRQLPDDYVNDNISKYGFLDYYRYYNSLTEFFDKDDIIIRVFEHTKKQAGGIFGDFCHAIDIDSIDDFRMPENSINTSLSPREIKLMIQLNQYNPNPEFSDMMVALSSKTGRTSAYQKHNILSPESRHKIRERFLESNRKLGNEILGIPDLYSEEPATEYVDLKEISLTADDAIELLGGVLIEFDRRISALEGR